MKLAAAATLLVTLSFCNAALAGPASGSVECEGVKHALKSAVALYVPEKLQFQVMFFAEALSEPDQALAARLEGASMLGRQAKGVPPPTAEDMNKRMAFGTQRALLVRGYLKTAADKVEAGNLRGGLLVSVNCGPNKSFNQSMYAADKSATADLTKQFPTFTILLKPGATVKLATAKYSRKPDPKSKSGSQMSASWQFQGEAKLQVFE